MEAVSCQEYRDISESIWSAGDQETGSCSENSHGEERHARQEPEGETSFRSET